MENEYTANTFQRLQDEKNLLIKVSKEVHISNFQEDYLDSLNLNSSDILESIVQTKYLNSKHAVDPSKVDLKYLSEAGISLYDYFYNAIEEYSMAKYIKIEFDLRRLK